MPTTMLRDVFGRRHWWIIGLGVVAIAGPLLILRIGAPRAGTERGPCYGNGTCNDGLSCISQVCVALPASAETAPATAAYAPVEARPATAASAAGAAAAAAVTAFASTPSQTYQSLDFVFEVIVNNLCACDEIYCLGERIKGFETWVSASDVPALARMLRESVRLASCTQRLYSSNRAIEAALQLNKLGKNAKRAFAEMSQYPKGEVSLTPATPCCEQPERHCQWTPSTWEDRVWKSLDFEVHESFMFQYSYESDGQSFTAKAVGDPDCRGKTVTFTMSGWNENRHPAMKLQGPGIQ